jgi:hypothetical protein
MAGWHPEMCSPGGRANNLVKLAYPAEGRYPPDAPGGCSLSRDVATHSLDTLPLTGNAFTMPQCSPVVLVALE